MRQLEIDKGRDELHNSRVDAEVVNLLDTLFRQEYGRFSALLIRQFNDFDLAEDALQDSYTDALATWPIRGIPQNPAGWLLQIARNKAIDRLRKQKRQIQLGPQHDALISNESEIQDIEAIPDERLRLILTCCHPAINLESQVALTLRMVGGMQTPEIARAFLVPEPTMAQRIVRAKKKIREAGIPFALPEESWFDNRLNAVLVVIYLIFNEGYSASSGDGPIRETLCDEAISLARSLVELVDERCPSSLYGLLALMLISDARRSARVDAKGDIVLLDDQDRGLWNWEQIEEAMPFVDRSLSNGPDSFGIQAAISALHSQRSSTLTDWNQIVALYGVLNHLSPSPVIELNQAVALGMAKGFDVGLARIESLAENELLEGYSPFFAARADFRFKTGNVVGACEDYEQALKLSGNEAERRFFARRLSDCVE